MVFHWSLSDRNSSKVCRTLLSILAVLNNAVVWMVSTRPPTSKSSRPVNNPLVTVPKAPNIIGIIVTFMFHSIFNSLARSRYLSFFSHFFSYILWSAGTAKSKIFKILFFCWLFSGLVFWPRLGHLCVLLLLLILLHRDIGPAVRVFANGPGDLGYPRSSHTKDFKNGTWYHLA